MNWGPFRNSFCCWYIRNAEVACLCLTQNIPGSIIVFLCFVLDHTEFILEKFEWPGIKIPPDRKFS